MKALKIMVLVVWGFLFGITISGFIMPTVPMYAISTGMICVYAIKDLLDS